MTGKEVGSGREKREAKEEKSGGKGKEGEGGILDARNR